MGSVPFYAPLNKPFYVVYCQIIGIPFGFFHFTRAIKIKEVIHKMASDNRAYTTHLIRPNFGYAETLYILDTFYAILIGRGGKT
jgi:hypothetical protein